MYRCLIVPLILLLALVAGNLVDRARQAQMASMAQHRAAMQALLAIKTPVLKYDRVPLRKVIEDLTAKCGLPIEADWGALGAHGVDPQAPVTARLYNVRVDKAFQVVLDSVTTPTTKLTYFLDDDRDSIRVVVSNEVPLVTEIYDIRDLLLDFGLTIELIQETIDEDSSRPPRGRGRATLVELDGRLVIRQAEENHRFIAGLLAQLRSQSAIYRSEDREVLVQYFRLAAHPADSP